MNIGHDNGFYKVKAITGTKTAHFESLVAKYVESDMSMNGHTTIAIDSRFGNHLVGPEAIKLGGTSARHETANWVESPEYMTLFYAALSELTTATQANVNLVTGLPLNDYQAYRGTLRDRLLGTHQFTRKDRRAQTIKVESVRVVPQAWGCVLALLLDDKGRIVQPELAKEKIAIIDAGGHTINFLSINGLSDIPSETRGTDRGAWNVVRAVRDFYTANYPLLNRYTDHEIMAQVVDGATWDGTYGEIDLTPVTRPIITDIGNEILATATQHWGQGAATFRRVIVCGGGAYLWGEQIKARLGHKGVVVMDAPEFANARGFYRFAANLGSKAG